MIRSQIEDIISNNTKSPDKLSSDLQRFIKEYGKDVILKELNEGGGDLFGDPKLTEIVKDYISGKVLDSSYIQSIDFSESDVPALIVNRQTAAETIFADNMIKPMVVTDYPRYKHELVSDYKPEEIYVRENIVDTGKLDYLCSPIRISMLQKCCNDKINEETPLSTVIETLVVEKNFSETNLGKLYYQFSSKSAPQVKVKTEKGVRYLNELLQKRINDATEKNDGFSVPKNVSNGDNSEAISNMIKSKDIGLKSGDFENNIDSPGIAALAERLHEDGINHKLGVNNTQRGEIPTGDLVNQGQSAPKSQGGRDRENE